MRYLLFIFIILASGWLKSSNSIPINLDEIAWIHDAQVYQWRSSKSWDRFGWDQNKQSMDWTSPDFRLFDQPHFAKYIYGFALTKTEINPWNNQNRTGNFKLFIEQNVSGKYLLTDSASVPIFGGSTIQAIQLGRLISLLFGVLTLLMIFLFLTFKYSLAMGSLTLALLSTNPTIFYNLHLATGDSISLFFIIVSLILFYFLFFNIHLNHKTRFLLLFLSALSTTFAISTKINGWLLIYLLLLGEMYILHRNRLLHWKNIVTTLCLWLFIFLGTYIYLQPELWTSFLDGLLRFFSQRLTQQQQFVQSFGTLGFLEYHKWIIQLTVQSNMYWLKVCKVILLGIALVKFFRESIAHFPRWRFFLKSAIIVSPIWLFFFYYARIDFDRYAIWPIIIFSTLSSWILTQKKILV